MATKGGSIALAWRAFGVRETCFRYSPKRDDENEMIADLGEGASLGGGLICSELTAMPTLSASNSSAPRTAGIWSRWHCATPP